jgi:hypothetical protein
MKNPKPELTRVQAWGKHDLMVIAAFRYCLGRRTYIVGACVDWLVEVWPLLDEDTKALIKRDLERKFEADDLERKIDSSCKSLGNDCDRQDWERVRALWKDLGQ